MAKKRIQKPTNDTENLPAVDCVSIGCTGNLSHSDYEEGSGFWLRYQKKDQSKLWRFTIKIEGARIDWKVWLEGAKPKAQHEDLESAEKARAAFNKLITAKKAEGYQFVHAVW